MIKSRFGDSVDGVIHRLLPFLFRRRVNPNLLTVLGALISLLAAAVLALGWFIVGGVLVLVGPTPYPSIPKSRNTIERYRQVLRSMPIRLIRWHR